MNDGALLASG